MPEWTYRGYTPEPLSVSVIIRGIDEGRVALPEFQRDFDWDQKRIVSLLTSVARSWPIGTLLIVQGEQLVDRGWGRRALEGAPNLNNPNMLVLDGQQRLTALYQAIRDDVSEDVYYCHITRVLERGELDDDDIVSRKKSRFQKEYPDKSAEAASGIIRISRLFFDDQFDEWLNAGQRRGYIDEERRAEMIRIRRGPLTGLREDSYSIPYIRLEGEVPLAVVAKIFETTNSGAMVLGTFDLMVAKLYPRDFNLREKWEEAKLEASPSFDEMDGLEVLQVIALREHLALREHPAGVKRVRGIRQSDVLGLDPGAVERDWDRAVAALERAVEFMKKYCGAIRWSFIPAHTMLIPLADALWEGEVVGEKAAQLRRWFWASTVHQTYAQGANTQAVTDAGELRAWFMSDDALPECIRRGLPDSLGESLADTRRRNQMLTRGVLCLLISRDARDWIRNTERLLDARDTAERIDIHHVFPVAYLKDRGFDGKVVANVTPLLGSTNKSLRSDPPSTVVERDSVRSSSIESHSVPLEAYRSDDWHGFVRGRVEMLTEAFSEELTR